MLNSKPNGKKIGILGKIKKKYGSLLFPTSQWRKLTEVPSVLWHSLSIVKVSLPTRWQFCPARWQGNVRLPPPPPSTLSSCPPLPAQLLGSSQWSWTVIDAVGSPRELDLSWLSAPAPCVEGSWIGQVSEKVSRGGKNLVQLTYPTKDSISLHCATTHPLLAPGTSWSQPPQLPGKNIPLQRCDGSRRGWTVIELEGVLITAQAHVLLGCRGW